MRGRRLLGLAAIVGAAASAFLIVTLARGGPVVQSKSWVLIFGAVAGILATATSVSLLLARSARAPSRSPSELELPAWVVSRPAELAAVVKALAGVRARAAGSPVVLSGAAGFGKTTLAQMACAHRRVRRRFRGRVYMVTVGRDLGGQVPVAAKVNDVIRLVAGEVATFTDPEAAGRRLASLLDSGPPRLLVLDDVGTQEQLAPFLLGGERCARLVTTREPDLLPGRRGSVLVDRMSPEQARTVLTSGAPKLDPAVVPDLLAATGRWPLLLRLVNRILADYARASGDVSAQAAALCERMRRGRPTVRHDLPDETVRHDLPDETVVYDLPDETVHFDLPNETVQFDRLDNLLGDEDSELDASDRKARERALRAVIEAGTGLLDRDEQERFAELGVFPEGEAIPFSLVARLWWATAGLDGLHATQVCKRLTELALVSPATGHVHGIIVHDVVHDFLRADLDQSLLSGLSGMLDNAVADIPTMIQPVVAAQFAWPAAAGAAAGSSLATVAAGALVNRWPPSVAQPVLRRVLTGHTGLVKAIAVAPDGRWLATGGSDKTVRIWDVATGEERAVLARRAERVEAVAVAPDGRWLAVGGWGRTVRIWDVATAQQRRALAARTKWVGAVAASPDGRWLATGSRNGSVRIWEVATGQQRGALAARTKWVGALAWAPDGSWLATAGSDETVRIWDVATGQERTVLTGHAERVDAVAVSPDGSWLATAGSDETVRIWDVATGQQRAVLAGHTGEVGAVAVSPDGSWLATGGWDKTVRIWDVATGQQRAVLTGHTGQVEAVAVSPDGSWLATGGWDKTVRIWDMATAEQRAALTARTSWVGAVAAAPDGSWLATAGSDETVRIWDVATGQQRAVLAGHAERVEAVAVSPDGSWLATGGWDKTVRIWDVATGQQRAVLAGHAERVEAVAVSPDGSWLATGGGDKTVRIWDVATGQERAVLAGHAGEVRAVAVAPDGSWLATGSTDETVRIWDAATGQERAVLTGHAGEVRAVAVTPDGSWLATGSTDETVRIWDAATGQERAVLTGHSGLVQAAAVSPDGSWLATGGWDKTVRIWDVATRQALATTQVGGSITATAWLGLDALAVGGSAGLHLFSFQAGSGSPIAPGDGDQDGGAISGADRATG